ncbi:MAG: ATP-binding protein [Pseudomonadota bacterium]
MPSVATHTEAELARINRQRVLRYLFSRKLLLVLVLWLISAWLLANSLIEQRGVEAVNRAKVRAQTTAAALVLGIENTVSVLHGIPQLISRNAALHQALQTLARKGALTENKRAELNLLLSDSLKHFGVISAAWLITPSGTGIATSGHAWTLGLAGVQATNQAYFQAAITGQSGQKFLLAQDGSAPGLYFFAPIFDQKTNKLIASVVTKVDIRSLSPWASLAEIYLTDRYGVIIFASNKALEMRTVPGASVEQLSPAEQLSRYQRIHFNRLNIRAWEDSRLPILKRFEGEAMPVLIQQSSLADGALSISLIQAVPAIAMLNWDRWRWFFLLATLGSLLIAVAAGFLAYIRGMRHVQNALWAQQEQLREAQRIAHIGSWQRDLRNNLVECSEEALTIFGGTHAASPVIDYATFMARLHPEDRERVRQTANTVIELGTDYDVQYRVMLPNSAIRHVHSRGKVTYDATGKALAIVGTVQDISARVAAENLIRHNEQTLRTAIDAIDEAFVLYDAQDRLVFCNEKFRQIYKLSADLLVPGESFSSIVRRGIERGQYPAALGRAEAWLRERITQHQRAQTNIEQALPDGRWLRTVERKTPSGYIVGFRVDITELKQAKEAAEAANQAKGEFLANMSHEIRTPMNGILGMNELLLQTDLDEGQREYAEIVKHSAQSLLGLINDILDFSKIDAGKLELERIDFDLRALIDNVGDFFSLWAAEKNIDLVCLVESSVPRHLNGDPGRLRQILLNLVGNAIKFTAVGEVTLSLSLVAAPQIKAESDCAKVALRIIVSDTGIGIAEEKIGILFSPFTQADASTTREYGGTGLGLSIARRLVELMGGHIGVESKLGQGTRFSLHLPYAQANQALESYFPQKLVRFEGKCVLIVDDSVSNGYLLTQTLSAWQCAVLCCVSGAEALSVLAKAQQEQCTIDLILIDMQMPVMDGETLAAQIRQSTLWSSVPLVALTHRVTRGNTQRFTQAGFCGYLNKPITIDHLQRILERVFASPQANSINPTNPINPTSTNTQTKAEP